MKRLLVALIFVGIAGCAGQNFKWDNYNQVKNGMTEADVVSLMGKPGARSANGNITALSWVYSSPGGAKVAVVKFQNGKVIGRE